MADLSLLHGGSPEDAQRHVAEALQYAARIGYAPVSSRIDRQAGRVVHHGGDDMGVADRVNVKHPVRINVVQVDV